MQVGLSARFLYVLTSAALIAGPSFSAEPGLERELARLAAISGGTMGVAAIHIESGRSAFLNPDEAFPMASTYKVPIAVQLLHRVDRDELRLSKMIDFEPGNLSPGSGTISRIFDDPGLSVSLHNLLELMLLISDNSATDSCLREAGGGASVTQRMKDIGIQGIRVDRSTLHLISDWIGVEKVPSREALSPDKYRELVEAVPEAAREVARESFKDDPRDSATPRAMGALLRGIWRGEVLSEKSTELLLDIMERCETGEARLKGLLPAGTVVAHKTGTIGATTNDVGIITLPQDAGHVIVAAFVKDSSLPVPERERAIAEVARAAHDYFLFTLMPTAALSEGIKDLGSSDESNRDPSAGRPFEVEIGRVGVLSASELPDHVGLANLSAALQEQRFPIGPRLPIHELLIERALHFMS